ncbi:orotidine 5'-phosphate decarboxylase [Candidatus Bathyarchaeota archaeon]|nr:orotidine 5'-phosphate decarboxylase [Candidatus Bathyarchaeota archaeon]
MSFKQRMAELAEKKDSNIVLALDQLPEDARSLVEIGIKILEKTHPYICAVKLNHHLVLPLGLFDGTKKIVDKAHNLNLPVIMDCKINDIGYTNRVISENYFNAGFDAVIANPFVGWDDGLQPVFEVAEKMSRGVILLVYMSHKAAWEGYGQIVHDPNADELKAQYLVFAQKALAWNADGAIVGATYPEKIREIRTILKEKVPIYSPGVGVQGGEVKAAVEAGSKYLIIGRSITLADNPRQAAKSFRDAAKD